MSNLTGLRTWQRNASARINRRQLLHHASVAGLAVGIPLVSMPVAAQDANALPELPLDNAQAKALMYTDDADQAELPESARAADEYCHSCRFFKGEDGQTTGFAACQIFPQHRVAAIGWCNTWTALEN